MSPKPPRRAERCGCPLLADVTLELVFRSGGGMVQSSGAFDTGRVPSLTPDLCCQPMPAPFGDLLHAQTQWQHCAGFRRSPPRQALASRALFVARRAPLQARG